uniref:Uncharacterized protein n=1 Tax=Anguilla anguilla TaxID=7936 RepID=A0A0E9XDV9_ANGAN
MYLFTVQSHAGNNPAVVSHDRCKEPPYSCKKNHKKNLYIIKTTLVTI